VMRLDVKHTTAYTYITPPSSHSSSSVVLVVWVELFLCVCLRGWTGPDRNRLFILAKSNMVCFHKHAAAIVIVLSFVLLLGCEANNNDPPSCSSVKHNSKKIDATVHHVRELLNLSKQHDVPHHRMHYLNMWLQCV
jgi:hypothetical protein